MKRRQQLPAFASRRRKISVEVYFVLYLSAIVLLLGTTTPKKGDRESELEEALVQALAPDFRIDAEKVALIYRFIPTGLGLDTSGVRLQRDSVNLIRARGTFSEVRFNIIGIEDTATGKRLPIESATLTRQGDRSALFTWRPRLDNRNAVYRVIVAAAATPLPPENSLMRPEVRNRIAEVLRRHTVSDSVTFTVNVFAVDNPQMLAAAQLPPTNIRRDSGIRPTSVIETLRTMTPVSTAPAQEGTFATPLDVPTVPQVPWSNHIVYSGLSNFQVSGGRAQISTIGPGMIDVSGVAPASGDQQITVTGVRTDGQKVSTHFTVTTRPLDDPRNLPQTFYPETLYSLDFSSSNVPNPQISVEVQLSGKTIKERSATGPVFNLAPAGTGRLVFIRYVGGQEMDRFNAEVRPLPLPIVEKPAYKPGDDYATVQTVSYGFYNGQKNVVSLKIEEGNAEEPVPGDIRDDPSTLAHYQTWVIKRRDNSKPLSFNVYALDRRASGSGKSIMRKFQGD